MPTTRRCAGFKQSLEEGGIRTPFIVSWPARFSGRRTIDTPVISLDILPTTLDALDSLPSKNEFDGKSLMPLLRGQSDQHHETLYWSKGDGEWAVRRGDWKLRTVGKQTELFDLAADPSETTNLSKQHPVRVKELTEEYVAWIVEMAEPITGGSKYGPEAAKKSASATDRSTDRKSEKQQQRAERKKAREAKKDAKPQAAVSGEAARSRPNVLFVVCDDLNTHVSTSGYPHITTPAFRQLADEGMTFSRAYCQYPVCGPSRASFLSGLYPESTGVLDNTSDIRRTRPGTVSLPQRFKESGYWTGAVGKVFHNTNADPGDVAWDEVLRFENDEMPLVTPIRKAFEAEHGSVEKGRARRLWRQKYPTIAKQTRGQQPGYGPSGLTDEQHKDGKNARQVAAWLKNGAHGDKPFFMACGIQKPHVPFLAPDKYFEMYPRESLVFEPASIEFWNQAPRLAMVKRYEGFGFEFGVENDALRREYMQAYHSCVSFIDAQIGLIFDALRESGRWEDTIVVLTSDHGYQLGEHFMWGKVTLFEVCDRVPLIVRVPGLTTPGSRSDGLVELVDLYPTLAQLCQVTAPSDLQGVSLVSRLEDASVPGKEVAYTVVYRGDQLGKAVRTERWRYTSWPVGEELYDLRTDPGEQRNLVTSTEHAETVADLRSHLKHIESFAASQRR